MSTSPRIIVKPSSALADEFARRAADVASQSVRERGRFSIALSGGSIAPALLPALARSAIRWDATSFFWIDERAVPPDDPESNYGSAMTLLSGTPAARARFHPMELVGDLERSARAYSDTLISELGMPPVLDIVMLGVGDDGHVASLFPGHAQQRGTWVHAEHRSPKPPSERISLTFETLAAARMVWVVVLGNSKANLVHRLLEAGDEGLPISRAIAGAKDALVFLDEEAASGLRRGAQQPSTER